MRLFVALAIALFLYNLQSKYYRRHWLDGLQSHIHFDRDVANIGDQVTLSEHVVNDKSLPLPVLYMKYKVPKTFLFDQETPDQNNDFLYRNDIFSLMPRQEVERKLQFVPTMRGYYSVAQLQLVSKSLFFTETLATTMPNQESLFVLPQPLNDANLSFRLYQSLGDLITTTKSKQDPFSFRGIRDYESFDEMRHINWKASAKTGSLKVNLYDTSTAKNTLVLLNLTPHYHVRSYDLQEYSIRLTTTILMHFLSQRIPISFATNGQTLGNMAKEINLGNSGSHYLEIQKSLAAIDLSKKADDFKDLLRKKVDEISDQTTIIVISTNREQGMINQFNECKKKHGNMIWLCPEFSSIPIKEQCHDLIRWEVDRYVKLY